MMAPTNVWLRLLGRAWDPIASIIPFRTYYPKGKDALASYAFGGVPCEREIVLIYHCFFCFIFVFKGLWPVNLPPPNGRPEK